MEGEVERHAAGEFPQFSLKIENISGVESSHRFGLAQTVQTDIFVFLLA